MVATAHGARQRADLLTVAQGLAKTCQKAQALIMAGVVQAINPRSGRTMRVDKAGDLLTSDTQLSLTGEQLPFVSRGGLKLAAALDAFALDVRGARCLDVGASTGGFTDCLLQRGATQVFALDVGHAQLHPKIRADGRVVVLEQVNIRNLAPAVLPVFDGLVIDVSFISLRLALPAALACLIAGGWLVALIKPQFEADRADVEKGGVVRNEAVRTGVIGAVRDAIVNMGVVELGLIDCPVAGAKKGNREALFYGRKL